MGVGAGLTGNQKAVKKGPSDREMPHEASARCVTHLRGQTQGSRASAGGQMLGHRYVNIQMSRAHHAAISFLAGNLAFASATYSSPRFVLGEVEVKPSVSW